jgi:hypothetical protein
MWSYFFFLGGKGIAFLPLAGGAPFFGGNGNGFLPLATLGAPSQCVIAISDSGYSRA